MSDLPTCWRSSDPRARIRHRCCECDGWIEPGESYNVLNGIWDGEALCFKTCSDCLSERANEEAHLRSMRDHDGIELGGLIQHFYDSDNLEGLRRMLAVCDRRASWEEAVSLRKSINLWE